MQTIFVLSEFRIFLFDIKSSNKLVPVGDWDFISFTRVMNDFKSNIYYTLDCVE
jgi:hypothetical protein